MTICPKCNAQVSEEGWRVDKALTKAKEVLGDE
jgi:hypothetical protein